MGAVLILDGHGFDPAAAERLLAVRALGIPRLRQRLRPVPPGCGRPIWIHDPGFDARRHVTHVTCPAPGDERALLGVAVEAVTRPLPPSGPLWSAVFVTGLAGDTVALILVVDHVLADGLGGLAILAGLLDDRDTAGGPPRAVPDPPSSAPGRSPLAVPGSAADAPDPPAPTLPELAADAFRARLRAVARLPGFLRDLRAAARAPGGLRPAPAQGCSLLRPTGPERGVDVVRVELAGLKAAAHRYGGTLNDAVLTVVTGALHTLLSARGESVEEISVAIPMTLRRAADIGHLGNEITPVTVRLPAAGDPGRRLRRISAVVGEQKASLSHPSPIALLGPLFRLAARFGLHRRWMTRQRFMHTLVSNVPGPDRTMALGGSAVRQVIPLPVSENGNMPVTFAVLSYAGTVVISTVFDPATLPDAPVLAAALREELAALGEPRVVVARPSSGPLPREAAGVRSASARSGTR
ncbi:putative diacyglycerol O-acyltransferase [Planobispora takensis]|uniref:diacylglycerol O-acyltransferase n=2 Tax=Planobispora takensis TaxID=1367882 RepID=A0A8J3X072_9ACTN|nr:putative diacyglycerol O-acyltransferase [Planobispora takensis]